jgi:hypothetical protein
MNFSFLYFKIQEYSISPVVEEIFSFKYNYSDYYFLKKFYIKRYLNVTFESNKIQLFLNTRFNQFKSDFFTSQIS